MTADAPGSRSWSVYFYEKCRCQALASSRTFAVRHVHLTQTSIEAATPGCPRAATAQAADPPMTGRTTNPTGQPIPDKSWRLRVRGSRWLRRHFYPCRRRGPGHQRLLREAWKRAPLLHCGSQVNPVQLHGRSHQLSGPTVGRRPSDRNRFQLRALRNHAGFQIAPERD
jgi:hypothetical protein